MYIKEVTYQKLVSFGTGNHNKVSAVVGLEKDESPEEGMKLARKFVRQQLAEVQRQDIGFHKFRKDSKDFMVKGTISLTPEVEAEFEPATALDHESAGPPGPAGPAGTGALPDLG